MADVLILTHIDYCPPAHLAQVLQARGCSFDVLRVEPDGSTLVAGRSAPNSTVTLRDGDKTLGTDTANRDGDFVIVLDQPLAPGDHSIQIQSKDDRGTDTLSRETAVVSVPERRADRSSVYNAS